MSDKPLVTVFLPAYNCEKYIAQAIDSVLAQTYRNFELLICNDGSTDRTEEIILSYADERIKYLKNEENIQLIATLNKGLQMASGKYLARMDADDICLPQRLEKQVELMEAKPEVIVCGSWVEIFGAESSVFQYPETHEEIETTMLFYSAISHPASIWRLEIIRRNNLKISSNYVHAEDYHFWIQCQQFGNFYNLQEVLLRYRVHEDQMGFVDPSHNLCSTARIKSQQLIELTGPLSDEEISEWLLITESGCSYNDITIAVIEKVILGNRKLRKYSDRILTRKLRNVWKNAIVDNKNVNLSLIQSMVKSKILFGENIFSVMNYMSVVKRLSVKIFSILRFQSVDEAGHEKQSKISYSQYGEDIITESFLPKHSGFYVDIGAHHPTRFSNTQLFYLKGWSGINIDAMPKSMEQFKKMRERDINLEIGISGQSEAIDFYQFDEPALNTFFEEYAHLAIQRGHKLREKSTIHCSPVSDVLNKHLPPGTEIDFMSIDIEGFELRVLQSNDWKKYKPKMLIIEHWCDEISDVMKGEMHLYLLDKGYKLVAKNLPCLFYLRNEK